LTSGGDSRISTNQAYSDFSRYYLGDPGPSPSISANALGFFWSLGSGTLNSGEGNDCGGGGWCGSPIDNPGTQDWWIAYPLTTDQRSYIGGDYNTWAGVPDGCIDFDGSNPTGLDTDQCMQVLLTDAPDGGFGGVPPEAQGYFAFLSVAADSVGFYLLHTAAFRENGTNAEIVMAPVPAPTFAPGDPWSVIPGGINVEFSLARPVQTCGGGEPYPQCMHGVYRACEGVPQPLSDVIKGYKVYVQELSSGSPIPFDRDVNNGQWVNHGPVFLFDDPQPEHLDITCSTGNDIYLCATLVFDGGSPGDFETPYCSANFPGSTIYCGCNSAADCDDGLSCTTDSCNGGVCSNVSTCNDGLGCTNDICGSGGCSFVSTCDDSVPCTVDTCTGGGCSFAPDNARCDDRVACTDDACNAGTGCANVVNNANCAFCDAGTCVAGVGCVPGTPPCPDACDEQGNACVGSGTPSAAVSGLTIEKISMSTDLTLTWNAPCNGDDVAIYSGEIGQYYSHQALVCNAEADDSVDPLEENTEDITPIAGSRYYLVVSQSVAAPVQNSREGSYGIRSNLAPRPPGSLICDPQEVVACP